MLQYKSECKQRNENKLSMGKIANVKLNDSLRLIRFYKTHQKIGTRIIKLLLHSIILK